MSPPSNRATWARQKDADWPEGGGSCVSASDTQSQYPAADTSDPDSSEANNRSSAGCQQDAHASDPCVSWATKLPPEEVCRDLMLSTVAGKTHHHSASHFECSKNRLPFENAPGWRDRPVACVRVLVRCQLWLLTSGSWQYRLRESSHALRQSPAKGSSLPHALSLFLQVYMCLSVPLINK